MSELRKPFLKSQIQKTKKQKINVKMLLGRKKPLEICNFDSNKKVGPE